MNFILGQISMALLAYYRMAVLTGRNPLHCNKIRTHTCYNHRFRRIRRQRKGISTKLIQSKCINVRVHTRAYQAQDFGM